jgi:hypothetical protein
VRWVRKMRVGWASSSASSSPSTHTGRRRRTRARSRRSTAESKTNPGAGRASSARSRLVTLVVHPHPPDRSTGSMPHACSSMRASVCQSKPSSLSEAASSCGSAVDA